MFNFFEKISLPFIKDKDQDRNVFNNYVGRDQYNGIVVSDPETGRAILDQQRKTAELSRYGVQYIKNQLESCKKELIKCNFNSFVENVVSISNGNLEGLPTDERNLLYFYLCLCGIINSDKEKTDRYFKQLDESYRKQIDSISTLTEDGNKDYCSLSSLYLETQSVVLLLLFNKKRYTNILSINLDKTPAIYFFKGLSYFNQNEFDKAEEMLEKVGAPDNSNVKAFTLLADIHKNIKITYEGEDRRKEVTEKSEALDSYLSKYPTALSENQVILAVTRLQVVLCTMPGDKEAFDSVYESLDEEIKNSYAVKAILADFQQRSGMFQEAVATCKELDWKNNAQIAVLYEYSLLQSKRYKEVLANYVEIDDSLKHKTQGRLESFCLSALAKTDHNKYLTELEDQLTSDPSSSAFIIFNTEEEGAFKQIIVPFFEQNFNFFAESSDSDMGVLVDTFIKFGQYDYGIKLLEDVQDYKKIPQFAVTDIYKELFFKAKTFSAGIKNNHLLENDLHKIESIADSFIENGIGLKNFYQIKVMCCQYLGKNLSAAEYARKLYALAPSEDLAANIVQFMHSLNNHNAADYEPYIKVLKESTVPSHMMALAFAYLKTGEGDAAESAAYRAIYYLNGKDDFDIFNAYIAFTAQVLAGDYENRSDIDKVAGNCIISLKSAKGESVITYCLDKEDELKADKTNESLGIPHLNKFSSTLYSKFMGGVVGQHYNIDGNSYTLVTVIDRYLYTKKYVLNKAVNNPDKITTILQTITGTTTEDSVEKIKQYMLEHKDNPMLDSYHFKGNEIGIPIDTLKNGDADSYLGTVAYLLQKKDEILYTGEVTSNVSSEKYVISLSSLVILCLLDQLSALDEFVEKLCIPSSLPGFIDERINSCGAKKVHSGGMLVAEDDKVFLLPDQSDKEIEIWEKIRKYCEKLQIVELTNDERIDFKLGDRISAEETFNAFRTIPIELDFFVVAKKTNAVYVCDDLFFRKMANWTGIPHMNVASFAYDIEDTEKAKVFVEKISEVNYLYAPYILTDDSEWSNRVLTNLTTKNKYKNRFYRPIISNAILNARREILSEMREAGFIPQNVNNDRLSDDQIKELEDVKNKTDDELKKEAISDPDCPPLVN